MPFIGRRSSPRSGGLIVGQGGAERESREAGATRGGTLGTVAKRTDPAKRVIDAGSWNASRRFSSLVAASSAHFMGLSVDVGGYPRVSRLWALHPGLQSDARSAGLDLQLRDASTRIRIRRRICDALH